MSFFSGLLGTVAGIVQRKSSAPTASAARSRPSNPLASPAAPSIDALAYPPRDPGLPVVPPEAILGLHTDLIEQLRIHASVPPGLFKARFLEPLERLAAEINALPGTPSTYFAGAGGMFRSCLELAFAAFRASDGRIFTASAGVEERHLLEVRWRYVVFLAGLLYPIGKSLQAMRVSTGDGKQWSPEIGSLVDLRADRVFVHWSSHLESPGPSPIATVFVNRVAGSAVLEYLHAGSPELYRTLIETAAGPSQGASGSIVAQVLAETFKSVLAREAARSARHYGRPTMGTHVAPWALDAMSALVRGHNPRRRWVLNEEVLFADESGAYLVWPQAALDILDTLSLVGAQGAPRTPEALVSLLAGAGIIEVDGAEPLFLEIADTNGEILPAVKVARPALLLESADLVAAGRPVTVAAIEKQDHISHSQASRMPVEPPSKKGDKAKAGKGVKQPTLDDLNAIPVDDDEGAPPSEAAAAPAEVDPDAPLAGVVESHLHPPQQAPSPQGVSSSGAAAAAPGTAATPSQPQKALSAQPAALNAAAAPAAVGAGGRLVEAVAHASGRPAASTPSGRVPSNAPVEAAEIDYASLIPEAQRKKLKPASAQILGMLIHAWRAGSSKFEMWDDERAIAVDYRFLAALSSDPVKPVGDWAAIGMLRINQARPGLKVQRIKPPGSETTIECIVFDSFMSEVFGPRGVVTKEAT